MLLLVPKQENPTTLIIITHNNRLHITKEWHYIYFIKPYFSKQKVDNIILGFDFTLETNILTLPVQTKCNLLQNCIRIYSITASCFYIYKMLRKTGYTKHWSGRVSNNRLYRNLLYYTYFKFKTLHINSLNKKIFINALSYK